MRILATPSTFECFADLTENKHRRSLPTLKNNTSKDPHSCWANPLELFNFLLVSVLLQSLYVNWPPFKVSATKSNLHSDVHGNHPACQARAPASSGYWCLAPNLEGNLVAWLFGCFLTEYQQVEKMKNIVETGKLNNQVFYCFLASWLPKHYYGGKQRQNSGGKWDSTKQEKWGWNNMEELMGC